MKKRIPHWQKIVAFTSEGFIAIASIALLIILAFLIQLQAPANREQGKEVKLERLVVTDDMTTSDVVQKLKKDGYIRNEFIFRFVLTVKGLGYGIDSGGYKIAKTMNAWMLARILSGEPYMRWVTIPEGVRKEEIAELLKKQGFLYENGNVVFEDSEGMYFPTKYLLPIDETWEQISTRMKNTFNEKFAPYQKISAQKNIKWYTALKIASLIQREAANADDMPLIAGILWNRLDKNMRLQLDATVQYIRGKTENGWWAPIKSDDKNIDSPYNTYHVSGLPPHPISNPGLDAIKAAFYPKQTDCLYYVHDVAHNTYCSPTFEEHKENIRKYL
ncbi:MAG: endolytic transglycosylase MltG [Patescibacteria group bacterium]